MPVMRLMVILVVLLHISLASCDEKIYYLSPAGNDSWSGTLAAANQNQTDGPFLTLTRAIKEIQSENCPVTVYFRGGMYPVEQTVFLSGQDSVPVRISAYPGEEVMAAG